MTTLKATEVRKDFREYLDRAAHKGHRIRISRNGKEIAALISADDLALLELLEDRMDAEEVRRRLSEDSEAEDYESVRSSLDL